MLGRVLLLFALLAGAMPADARRVALIIANGRYANAPQLANPIADSKLIEASLRRAGFDDVQTRTNLGKAAVEAELRAFGIAPRAPMWRSSTTRGMASRPAGRTT